MNYFEVGKSTGKSLRCFSPISGLSFTNFETLAKVNFWKILKLLRQIMQVAKLTALSYSKVIFESFFFIFNIQAHFT